MSSAQKELCSKIAELFRRKPYAGMESADVAEVLVAVAYELPDWNGGIGDTMHAADHLREIVNRIEALRIPPDRN
jgi:hypothetical protein